MHEQNNTNGQGEAQRFAEAIAIANIPTLLMVLVQLTGELRWLEEPYQPRRARGMNDNDTGGLPELKGVRSCCARPSLGRGEEMT